MADAGTDRPVSPQAMDPLGDLDEPELIEERDFLLASLTDLDAELTAGDIDQHDYLALKAGYTARAAAVLRAIDRPASESDPPSQRSVRDDVARAGLRPAEPRRWRAPAVLVCVATFAVVAGLLVAHALGQRLAAAPLTGSATTTGSQPLLRQAAADLTHGKYLDAVTTYDRILRQDPRNPEALAYRGWILRLTGKAAGDRSLVDRGLASLQAAEAVAPGYPDAHFFTGVILLCDKSDATDAVAEFRQVLATNPPQAIVPVVQGDLNAAVAAAAAPGSAPATTPACAA